MSTQTQTNPGAIISSQNLETLREIGRAVEAEGDKLFLKFFDVNKRANEILDTAYRNSLVLRQERINEAWTLPDADERSQVLSDIYANIQERHPVHGTVYSRLVSPQIETEYGFVRFTDSPYLPRPGFEGGIRVNLPDRMVAVELSDREFTDGHPVDAVTAFILKPPHIKDDIVLDTGMIIKPGITSGESPETDNISLHVVGSAYDRGGHRRIATGGDLLGCQIIDEDLIRQLIGFSDVACLAIDAKLHSS